MNNNTLTTYAPTSAPVIDYIDVDCTPAAIQPSPPIDISQVRSGETVSVTYTVTRKSSSTHANSDDISRSHAIALVGIVMSIFLAVILVLK